MSDKAEIGSLEWARRTDGLLTSQVTVLNVSVNGGTADAVRTAHALSRSLAVSHRTARTCLSAASAPTATS
jgi:hypothetical protein